MEIHELSLQLALSLCLIGVLVSFSKMSSQFYAFQLATSHAFQLRLIVPRAQKVRREDDLPVPGTIPSQPSLPSFGESLTLVALQSERIKCQANLRRAKAVPSAIPHRGAELGAKAQTPNTHTHMDSPCVSTPERAVCNVFASSMRENLCGEVRYALLLAQGLGAATGILIMAQRPYCSYVRLFRPDITIG